MTDDASEDAAQEAFDARLIPELQGPRDLALEARWAAWIARAQPTLERPALERAKELVEMAVVTGLGERVETLKRIQAQVPKLREPKFDKFVAWLREGRRLVSIEPGSPDWIQHYAPMFFDFVQLLRHLDVDTWAPIVRKQLEKEPTRYWTRADFTKFAREAIAPTVAGTANSYRLSDLKPGPRLRRGGLLLVGELVEVVFPTTPRPRSRGARLIRWENALRKRTQNDLGAARLKN